MIDAALWSVPPTEAVSDARWKMIHEVRSDLELSRIALAAESGSQGAWLGSESERVLASGPLFDQARAITLIGLMTDAAGEAVLDEWSRAKRPDWLDEVIAVARKRRQRDGHARHWFEQFIHANDDVHAWAGFRLFLRCADRRFWIWRDELQNRAPFSYTDKRKRYLSSQTNCIEKRMKEVDGALAKVFLAGRVLAGQVWPWNSRA
jgi:hypothetical protein